MYMCIYICIYTYMYIVVPQWGNKQNNNNNNKTDFKRGKAFQKVCKWMEAFKTYVHVIFFSLKL